MKYVLTKEDEEFFPVLGCVHDAGIHWIYTFNTNTKSKLARHVDVDNLYRDYLVEKEFTADSDEEAIRFVRVILELRS